MAYLSNNLVDYGWNVHFYCSFILNLGKKLFLPIDKIKTTVFWRFYKQYVTAKDSPYATHMLLLCNLPSSSILDTGTLTMNQLAIGKSCRGEKAGKAYRDSCLASHNTMLLQIVPINAARTNAVLLSWKLLFQFAAVSFLLG